MIGLFSSRIMSSIVLIALFTSHLSAKEDVGVSDSSEEFLDVANELRCPTCTGLSVLDSDASFSVQIKDQVKQQMGEGRSKEEILDFFVERYGPWILREPPKEGFNLIAWLVPIGMFFIGPMAIWAVVWRKKQTVQTFGVRSNSDIVQEMKEALEKMSKG